MNIVSVDPRTDPIWQTLVQKASSSVFHSPAWIQVLKDTYGWEARAYVVLDSSGEPRAGIPFCRVADMMGERVLAPGLDELWRAMQESTQRAIRKSQRDGLVIRVADSEQELRAFFEMHLKIRKYKLGLLAQPFQFFQNIWRHFVDTQHGFLLLALYQDKIVAGDFFLEWKDTLYYKFNASLPADLSHRPNDLLIWEGIQRGKARGFSSLDFGLSDIDQEGLVRYKRKFGTQEKIISFLRHAPEGVPSLAEKQIRNLLAQLTHRFTNQLVPDVVTEGAGEDLYRLFA